MAFLRFHLSCSKHRKTSWTQLELNTQNRIKNESVDRNERWEGEYVDVLMEIK